MATPQWVLLQRRLMLQEKVMASQFSINTEKRHRDAMLAAKKKGFLRTLDEELIIAVQKYDGHSLELDQIRRISLFACPIHTIAEMTIAACTRLVICNLPNCYLTDISAFYSSVYLLKLDLSCNHIVKLPDTEFWSSLLRLKVVYLHGNLLNNRESLLKLAATPQLHILTMYDTPVSLHPTYRHTAVNCVLSLKALDHHVISDEEIIENLQLDGKLRALSNTFKIQLYNSPQKGMSYPAELKSVHQLLLMVDTVLAHLSPVVIIQRWVRGWLCRCRLVRSNNQHIRAFMQTRLPALQRKRLLTAGVLQTIIKKALPLGSSSPKPLKTGGSVRPSTQYENRPARHHDDQQQQLMSLVSQRNTTVPSSLPVPPPCSPIHHLLVPQHMMHSQSKSPPTSPLSLSWGGSSKDFRPKKERFRGTSQPTPTSTTARCTRKRKDKDVRKKRGDSTAIFPHTTINHTGTIPPVSTVTEGIFVQQAKVSLTNKVAETIVTKRENGRDIRDAEKDITEMVADLRKPNKIDCGKVKPTISKEMHAFIRAHNTMPLSVLKTIDKLHRSQRKAEERAEKAALVSQMKQERLERKEKIQEYQATAREVIMEWKIAEEVRLKRMREKQKKQKQERQVHRAAQLQTMADAVKNRTETEQLASKFSQQNVMIANTLSRENRRVQKESALRLVREQTQELREEAREQHEIVKKFMQLREEKLHRENMKARTQLNAKMIEAASHQLLEAKKKAAKVIAMKKAAREARQDTEMVYSCLKPTSIVVPKVDEMGWQSAPVTQDTNLTISAPKHSALSTDASAMKQRSPSHFWRSWQRGSFSLSEQQEFFPGRHFPRFPPLPTQPLSFEMMRPLPHFHSICQTPANSYLSNEDDHHTPLDGDGTRQQHIEEIMKQGLILQMTK